MREIGDTGRITGGDGGYLDWRVAPGRTVEITDITAGRSRRRGTGRGLVTALVSAITDRWDGSPNDKPAAVYAITRISNTIAHEFYEALGFHLVGRLHGFYRDGGTHPEHALVYMLEL